jgi:RNA polymerase sigma-70 factor, ECF subfamily
LLDEQEIKRLLLATAARDVEAFERLYRRCAPLLLGIAQRVTRRKELAEEVLHDSFVRIWRAADTFDPLGAPVGWMTTIVRNRAIDLMETHDMARVDSYHAALDDKPEASLDQMFDWSGMQAAENADDRLDASRMREFLRRCLGELAAPERQALVLAYEHGLSHGDLAAHLNKPLGTVKTWIRRGMNNLRACIDECTGSARASTGRREGVR